jgi:hypothetical protein
MRNYILRKMTGLALLAVVVAGCDTASQDVEPVISPDNYPVATFTTDFTGETVTEGDTISYVITVDKQLDKSITFHVIPDTGNVADDHDYAYEPAVLQPYTSEVSMMVIVPQENLVEPSETFSFEIGPTSLADKYLLNPSTENPVHDLTIINVNVEGKLTINMDWNNHDDNDFGVYSETAGLWSLDGATGDQPEIDMTIWNSDPDGDYYLGIWDWGNPAFDYVFTFGLDDNSMDVIEGTFNPTTAPDLYDTFLYSEDYPPFYKVIKVTKSGSSYTYTKM